jgi:hypothetical protein
MIFTTCAAERRHRSARAGTITGKTSPDDKLTEFGHHRQPIGEGKLSDLLPKCERRIGQNNQRIRLFAFDRRESAVKFNGVWASNGSSKPATGLIWVSFHS